MLDLILTRKPIVPMNTPTPQRNHQLKPLSQLQPSQSERKPYGNKTNGPLMGPISAIKSITRRAVPSSPEESPLLTSKSAKGKGKASLKKAAPIGR